jgi:ribosomal protein S27AE
MKKHRSTCACRRCGGMIIATHADLLSPSRTGDPAIVWRCVNCGEYVDRQVLLNRSVQRDTTHMLPREARHRSLPQRA